MQFLESIGIRFMLNRGEMRNFAAIKFAAFSGSRTESRSIEKKKRNILLRVSYNFETFTNDFSLLETRHLSRVTNDRRASLADELAEVAAANVRGSHEAPMISPLVQIIQEDDNVFLPGGADNGEGLVSSPVPVFSPPPTVADALLLDS